MGMNRCKDCNEITWTAPVAEHTPTPWFRNVSKKQPIYAGTAPDFTYIAHVLSNDADLDFIVRAVNAHEQLLRAMKEALKVGENQGQAWKWAPILRDAIAKAEGK